MNVTACVVGMTLWGLVAWSACRPAHDASYQGPRCHEDQVHAEVQLLLDDAPLLTSADIASVRTTSRALYLLLRPNASSLLAEKSSEKIGKELVVMGHSKRVGARFEVTEAITGGRVVLERPAYDDALPILCAAVVGDRPSSSKSPDAH